MEPPAAALDSTPDPAIVQPPGSSPPVPAREQQQEQEQLRIGESGRFGEGPEDRAVSVMRYSASSFGFAFDATLDVLSSAIVLWRYSNAAAVHSAHREYIACVILGVIFLLSSICIVIKAIHDLAKRVLPEVDDFLYSVSVLSGILCTVLAVIKFMLGKVLTSRALITDGCLLIWCPAYGKRATMKCLSEDHTPLLCKDSKTSAVWASGANGILFNMPFVSRGPFLLKFVLLGNLSVKLAYVHTACNSVKQQHFSFNMLLIPVTIENMQCPAATLYILK
ncbi:transmembrane protein 163 isoform X1 [Tympanuchus pallidicinctus]|uniref:transmembrane protein 163 isoform X1 n=2 Tax=Tympanuchus pallidicinctus TaxID=109042 RepID=UPI002287318C|nr:transmembrane protein 163 isoform X1 [Tympanuchus pallidicinctus]